MIKVISKSFMFISTLLFFGVANAGFGVSPGQIDEDKLVPGSTFESTIYLVQSKPEEDLNVQAIVESAEMKDWFSFENGEQFFIPAGVQQYPLKVTLNVPEDTELGEYKAFLRVTTVPPDGVRDGQVNIALGGRIDYTITIGDDVIKEYSVPSIKILDINQNQDPKAEFKIKNTGNVSAAPIAASFELFNKFGTVRLGYTEVDEFKKVPSFSEDTQTLEFPIDIKFAPGEYRGDVKVYNDEGEIIANTKTVFNVKEGGAVAGAIFEMGDKMSWVWWVIGIILGLFILRFVLRAIFFGGRRRSKKNIK